VALFASLLCFKLEVVDPAVIPTVSFLQFRSELSRHLPCRHLIDLQHFVGHKVSETMTDIQHGSHFIHLDTVVHVDGTFSIHSCLQCYNSVGLAQMSYICDTGHHILKIPTTFVHLLQR